MYGICDIYIVYGRKEDEDMIATKVRMYCQQKKKMSSSLPPDTNSMRHDMLRKHHQAYIWRRCLQHMVDPLPLEGNGWKMDDGFVVPVWYTCPQLPPTIQKKGKKNTQHICNTSHNVPTLEAPQIITEVIDAIEYEESDWEHYRDFNDSTGESDSSDSDWEA